MTTQPHLDPATRVVLEELERSPAARTAWDGLMETIQRALPGIMRQIGPAIRFDELISPATQANIVAQMGPKLSLGPVIPPANVIAGSGFYNHLRGVLDDILQRRVDNANWWLPDHVDPAEPSWIRGLEEAMPTGYRRRSIDAVVHALEQWRALLHYRHRRVPDSPGQRVTARRRIPRGPDFRRLTFPCQPAGFVVRA